MPRQSHRRLYPDTDDGNILGDHFLTIAGALTSGRIDDVPVWIRVWTKPTGSATAPLVATLGMELGIRE
jgi:hypothetical protein